MNIRIYTTLIIVVICLFSNIRDVLANDVTRFYNLNEEYGVSFRQTNMVCSDSNGFVWISSKMGVIRYTQNDIKFYELPYETADVLHVNLKYKNGILIAYANNGQIFKYNTVKDQFEKVINISKIIRNPYIYVSSILIDNQNKIWIASTVGMFSYDEKSGLIAVTQNNEVNSLAWYDDYSFFYDVNGEIKLYDIRTLTSENYFRFSVNDRFRLSKFYFDEKIQILWIGSESNGFYYINDNYKEKKLSKIPEIPSQPILAIESISDSIISIGVDGQGIWEINRYTKKVSAIFKDDSDNPYSLKGNGVYDIYLDNNKRVWVCTYSGGVSFFDQENTSLTKFNHVTNNTNSLVNDDVNSILEDKQGNLWFATNNGVSLLDKKNNKWYSFFHNKQEQSQVFLSLCEDNKGRIWAGTYSSGLYLIDSKSKKVLDKKYFEETDSVFSNKFIYNILKDRNGDIWFGGIRGDLVCYKVKENRFKSYSDAICYLMVEYDEKYLLLGKTYGLFLFNKETGEQENLINGHVVYDIYPNNNIIWVATCGDGLIKYDLKSKKKIYFTKDSGLPSNFVNSIEHSGEFLWIGTEQGMCRLNVTTNAIVSFSSKIELNNTSFNQNSHYALQDGRLIWGTNKGVIVFDPQLLEEEEDNGKIFLQDITISGSSVRDLDDLNITKSIDSLDEITLKYFQNTISVEMIPIVMNSTGSKFSWKLEGLNEDWSTPGKNNIISYSNLPSNIYNLRIRMFDNALSNLIQERSLKITIVPPYYRMWWFNVLVLSVIGGLGIFLFKYYIHNLKKIHSEEKIRFFANTAHDIRTSLTLINGPIEELNKEEGLSNKALNYLHLATDQTHRLLKVVNHLMDFQKVDIGKEYLLLKMHDVVKILNNRVIMFESYAKSRNIKLFFNSNVDEYITAIDEVMIEKVIDNLISNAIKYSESENSIRINFVGTKLKWQLEVIDNGIGIDKNAQKLLFKEYYRAENAVNSKIVGSGIGLLLVKNYISLHKGKISYESQPDSGSIFRIEVPYVEVENKELEGQHDNKTHSYISNYKKIEEEIDQTSDLKMKVLVVEDNEYLQEFLASAMIEEYEILIANDGMVAWEIIIKEMPDLIVSDIMMPNMDGFDLCTKLKSTYETSHIPIVLLTALADKAQELKGLGLGADDYLTKPFDITILQHRIKTIIQNRQISRDKALKIIKINDDEKPILENKINDKFIKQMVKIVRENISNSNFSKNDFAAEMNVSSSLLYKKVKALTNQSPTDFIKSIRLDYSLELLQTKEYTITEISEMCGFSSVGYFSTVFRKHFNKSPSQLL